MIGVTGWRAFDSDTAMGRDRKSPSPCKEKEASKSYGILPGTRVAPVNGKAYIGLNIKAAISARQSGLYEGSTHTPHHCHAGIARTGNQLRLMGGLKEGER